MNRAPLPFSLIASAAVGLCAWAAGSLPVVAQTAGQQPAHQAPHQPQHGDAHHGAVTHEQIQKALAGLTDAEKHFLHQKAAKMSDADRKKLVDRLTKLSAADRRKLLQQMMKSAPPPGHKPGHGQHGGHSAAPDPNALRVGDRVPDFTLVDVNGKSWKLSDLQKETKSGVVSLTFWCSFCHSCRGVEGRLDQFADKQRDRATVLAVDASAGETADRVKRFAKQRGLGLPIYLDAPGKTSDLFGVRVTTTTVVIDAEGLLRYRGQFADDQHRYAEDALKSVLAGQPVMVKETALQG